MTRRTIGQRLQAASCMGMPSKSMAMGILYVYSFWEIFVSVRLRID